MKKISVLLLLLLCVFLSSCAQNPSPTDQATAGASKSTATAAATNSLASSGDTVNITENLYVTYVNEIYTNPDDYVGKTIKIEGMFTYEYYEKMTYYYVYRTGPGCCGTDGSMCGFEITYDGEIPEKKDWIEVIGTLRKYEEDGYYYLTLDVTSLKVLDKRGAETVYR